MVQEGAATSFADLDEQRRKLAMIRFAVLQPHLEGEVPLVGGRCKAQPPAATST